MRAKILNWLLNLLNNQSEKMESDYRMANIAGALDKEDKEEMKGIRKEVKFWNKKLKGDIGGRDG